VRKKLIIAGTAGVLALGGVVVAMPVLADTDSTTAADRVREALTGLVEDGSITEEQADEVATTLSEAGLARGGHHGGRLGLEAAASALDMSEEELRTALEPEGTSLADVAEAQDVDVDTLVDALVQAEEERIAQAVEDGRLPQEEADERLADLEERVTERVNSADLGGRGHHGHRGPGAGDGD
jgi:polyhydroxyalkanoate synthesis regulator phasin